MADRIITLKNIYRILKENDFPIYSDGVFSRAYKRGMTLSSFWEDIFLPSWKDTACGRKIWYSGSSRHKHLSELCNRKLDPAFFGEYAGEIRKDTSQSDFLKQIRKFEGFLLERKFRADPLKRKVQAFLLMASEEEEDYGKRAADWFQKTYRDIHCEGIPSSFLAAWDLTVLTLLAIAGPYMQSREMIRFLERAEFRPEKLYAEELKEERKQKRRNQMFLTKQVLVGLDALLPRAHFFGREKALFDLEESCRLGSKILICGESGVGKTELVFQYLRDALSRGAYSKIAAVSCRDGLMEGMLKSFDLSDTAHVSEADRYRECLDMITRGDPERTLLILDDLQKEEEGRPALAQILHLPCPVIAISQDLEIRGFYSYCLEPPDEAAAVLIFRHYYGKAMTTREQENLRLYLQENHVTLPVRLRELGEQKGQEL